MFIGEYNHSLDPKGRLIIPSKLRDGLGDDFVITKGLDSCLFLYPQSEWKLLEDKLKDLPLTSKDARSFIRFFFSGASHSPVDKQGRILIPQNLREYSGLSKEVSILGVGTRVEIWDRQIWIKYNEENLSPGEIAIKMEDLGI